MRPIIYSLCFVSTSEKASCVISGQYHEGQTEKTMLQWQLQANFVLLNTLSANIDRQNFIHRMTFKDTY